jgi:hypothetical protein
MNKSGIQDLMDKQRFRSQHIQKALLEAGAPGNWKSIQNVYNLVKGTTTPKDPYVYVVLSNLLMVDIDVILYRYTSARKKTEAAAKQEIDLSDSAFNW